MLPDNELSGKAHIAGFSFPVKSPLPEDKLQDWELAGVYLNDPFQGLMVKLWHLKAVVNYDTDQVEVIVSAPGGVAPGEPSRVLFSGVDITEVALTFDQNMNPFVAYMQGGDAKIYWFDSTVSSMVHTTLPSGCYDLRCTLDDKRNFNVAESDIVLGYIRDGNLCIRYQRDRYTIEYVLRSGIGGNARLVSMAMNVGSRLQFRLRNYALTDDPGALLQADPFLADVVADLLRRSNVPPEHIDTDQLWVPIEGYRIANEGGADSNIVPLQQAWFFDPGEWDKKLRFIMRGAEPVAHITFSDLLERQGNNGPMQMERVQEIELLRKVNLTTVDSTAGWIGNKQTAERRSATIRATGESSTILPITMHPDFAATIATKRLRIPWGEPHKFHYGLGVPWSMLTPTDVITYEDNLGRVYQIRLGQIEEDYGSFQYESTTNARWIYDLTATGTSAPPWIPTTPGQAGDTVLEIINAPVNREADDELGLYIAARGTGSAWSGGVLLVSTDGGANYVQAATLDAPATIGETESAMSDNATTVDVVVPDPLESVTDDQIAAGNNRAFIGDEEVQFKTATLTLHDDDGYHYTLTGVVRNVLRTAAVAHSSGSRFVLFDDAVVFMQVARTLYDTDIKYKAVTAGQNADDVAEATYHLKPMYSQMEWAVNDVAVTIEGGLVTWQGSPRIGTFGPNPFHSKYMIGYRVKRPDGSTIDTTAQILTVEPPQAGTYEIRALNAITGEGPLTDGSGGGSGGGGGGSGGPHVDDPGYWQTWEQRGSLPNWPVGEPFHYFANGQLPFVFKGVHYGSGVNSGGLTVNVSAYSITAGPYPNTYYFMARGVALTAHTSVAAARFASDLSFEQSHEGYITQSITWTAKPSFGRLNWWPIGHFEAIGMPLSDPSGDTIEFKTVTYGPGSIQGKADIVSGKRRVQLTVSGYDSAGVLYLTLVRQSPTSLYKETTPYGSYTREIFADGIYTFEIDADNDTYELLRDGTGVIASGAMPRSVGQVFQVRVSGKMPGCTVFWNAGNHAWADTPTAGFSGVPNTMLDVPVQWEGLSATGVLSTMSTGASPIKALYGGEGIALGSFGQSSGSHHVQFQIDGGSSHANFRVGLCSASQTGELGTTGDSICWRNATRDDPFHKLQWTFGGGGSAVLPGGFGQPGEGLYFERPMHVVFVYDAAAGKIKCMIRELDPGSAFTWFPVEVSVPAGTYFPARYQPPSMGPSYCVMTSDTVAPTGADDWTVSI